MKGGNRKKTQRKTVRMNNCKRNPSDAVIIMLSYVTVDKLVEIRAIIGNSVSQNLYC